MARAYKIEIQNGEEISLYLLDDGKLEIDLVPSSLQPDEYGEILNAVRVIKNAMDKISATSFEMKPYVEE